MGEGVTYRTLGEDGARPILDDRFANGCLATSGQVPGRGLACVVELGG